MAEGTDLGYGRGGTIEEAEVKRRARGLDRLQRNVALKGETEIPFAGQTVNGYEWDTKEEGIYISPLSGAPLFSSSAKFDSGTGWPSFWEPIDADSILERTDPRDEQSLPPDRWRVEVLDRASMTHLGHVFSDGPPPTGRRYCINAAALRFVPATAQPFNWTVTEGQVSDFLWSLLG